MHTLFGTNGYPWLQANLCTYIEAYVVCVPECAKGYICGEFFQR
jgi:hypothetical protein